MFYKDRILSAILIWQDWETEGLKATEKVNEGRGKGFLFWVYNTLRGFIAVYTGCSTIHERKYLYTKGNLFG